MSRQRRRLHLQAHGDLTQAVLTAVWLLAVLSPLSMSAKPKTVTLFRMEVLGNCPDYPDLVNGFSESSVFRAGRTQWGRGVFVFNRTYTKFTKAVVRFQKCESRNDPNCVPFTTWRFADETCSLLTMKNMIWTPLFYFEPPMRCHPLRAGAFNVNNVTVDIDRLQLIKFPTEGYWKVNVEVDADHITRILCYYFEGAFIKVRL